MALVIRSRNSCLAFVAALAAALPASAATISVQIPGPGSTGLIKQSPAGHSEKQGDLGWDAVSLIRNGKPWLPAMGEFHFSRYPAAEWRDELLKMKAGGITMISTYVFWIHHEEEQGKFTWDGDKNLRQFVQTCADVGLPVIVRVGPWCHGEVRNGGFPDWVQTMPRKRQNDPAYLAAVKPYYDQIGQQLKGLMWKDNGPVVGIQFENEFKGPASHLVTLKQMGLAAGLDVPIYTRTAWDNATNVPTFGEVLPLWGGYAEGFWDRSLDTMPGNYWQVFQFGRDRAPANAMGADPNAAAEAAQRGEVLAYPYLTCELGGGMMSSYHRRIDISPMDVYTVALAKVGSGSNMPGYYMYHGGTNPDGKLSYLMESQSPPQNMWNDMPVKNYDFGAPLGAAGEIRESYHLARRLHMFLADWGDQLARMPATLGPRARNQQDTATVRCAVRSDGHSGFLFVNNYQRGIDMPVKNDTQFKITLADGKSVTIPDNGSNNIPANTAFIWPFNLDLGGANLLYATAQPLFHLTDGDTTYTFFAQTPGVNCDFVFQDKNITIEDHDHIDFVNTGAPINMLNIKPDTCINLHTPDGKKQVIYIFTDAEARNRWKGTLAGKEHMFHSESDLTFDGNSLNVLTNGATPNALIAMPPLQNPTTLGSDRLKIQTVADVNAQVIEFLNDKLPALGLATAESLHPAGPLRTIPIGSQKVAAEPTDADFDNAAVFKINLPPESKDPARKILLRLHYTGDVARVYLGEGGGKLLLDDFYHGQPLDLALWRYPDLQNQPLTVKIIPLQKGAPIYMAKWPEFDGPSVARIDSVELIENRTITVQTK